MGEYLNQVMQEPFVVQLIIAVVTVGVMVAAMKLARNRVGAYMIDHTNSYRTKKAINAVGYVLIVLWISIIYRDSLGSLTVFLGIAGAGIAFALKEVIVSIAGWATILFSDVYKSGDRVILGGIKGDVIDVGVLRTTIMEIGGWVEGDLYNGRIVRIANSFVFTEPVHNYSADFPFLWDEIKLPVRYGSNYSLVREILYEVADEVVGDYSIEAKIHWGAMVRKFMIENATIQPMVTIVANDNWVEFNLRYVVDYKERVSIKDKLFSKVLERVESNSDQVQLSSTTIELVESPDSPSSV